VNTKRKVKMDATIPEVSLTGERISMIKAVHMMPDEQSMQPISIQFRLYATYNQKDKCIGFCEVNLTEYMNN
jgi:hypothetical protein